MINELLCDVLEIRFFLKGMTYSASVENSLLPEKKSEGRETNVRTAGVGPTWLQMLIRMKSQVVREREGDLTMNATVARVPGLVFSLKLVHL